MWGREVVLCCPRWRHWGLAVRFKEVPVFFYGDYDGYVAWVEGRVCLPVDILQKRPVDDCYVRGAWASGRSPGRTRLIYCGEIWFFNLFGYRYATLIVPAFMVSVEIAEKYFASTMLSGLAGADVFVNLYLTFCSRMEANPPSLFLSQSFLTIL